MLGDYAALTATVAAAPEDDLPRLVLADWLEESDGRRGQLRAEFIRSSVAGRFRRRWHPHHVCSNKGAPISRRKWLHQFVVPGFDLVGWYEDGWVGYKKGLPNWPWRRRQDLRVWRFRFRKGLIDQVWAPFEAVRRYLPELVSRHPIRTVFTEGKRPYVTDGALMVYWPCQAIRHPEAEYVFGDLNDLPLELFERLRGEVLTTRSFAFKDYKNEKAAIKALSNALLEEARAARY